MKKSRNNLCAHALLARTALRLLPTGWSSCSSRSVIMYLRAVAAMSHGPWNSGSHNSDGSAAAVPLQH